MEYYPYLINGPHHGQPTPGHGGVEVQGFGYVGSETRYSQRTFVIDDGDINETRAFRAYVSSSPPVRLDGDGIISLLREHFGVGPLRETE